MNKLQYLIGFHCVNIILQKYLNDFPLHLVPSCERALVPRLTKNTASEYIEADAFSPTCNCTALHTCKPHAKLTSMGKPWEERK